MTLQVFDSGGTDRTISSLEVFDAGGTNRVISEIRVFDASGTDRIIFTTTSGIPISASPTSVAGYAPTGPATSNSTTVTPLGGVAPYTYSWVVLSQGAVAAPTINSPTSATTDFTQGGLGAAGGYIEDVFRCNVTDTNGLTGFVDVPAYFYRS